MACKCFHTGQPSIKKCKTVRMKREEAQELAELDVSNIIATQGNYLSLFLVVAISSLLEENSHYLVLLSSKAEFFVCFFLTIIHWPRKEK